MYVCVGTVIKGWQLLLLYCYLYIQISFHFCVRDELRFYGGKYLLTLDLSVASYGGSNYTLPLAVLAQVGHLASEIRLFFFFLPPSAGKVVNG